MVLSLKSRMRKGRLFIILLVLSGLALTVSASGSVDEIDFQDLVVEGWALDSITEGTYGDYVELWEGLGVVPSDYLMGEAEPLVIYFLMYSNTVSNSSVYVEIHLFESEGDARTEFSFQKQWAPDAPIFERFLYGRRMYQEGNVLLFFFSDAAAGRNIIPYGRHGQEYIAPVDSFIVGFFERFSTYIHEVPEAPASDTTVRCVGGIRPGDVISWGRGRETFTGSLGTGMSHSEGSSNLTLEVVEFTEGGSHVLVRERHESFKVFNEYGSSVILDLPFYSYGWLSAAEGLSWEMGDGPEETLIYPLYYGGRTIRDVLEGEIDHLPEKSNMEGEHSISAHGRTASASGYTPLKTEWRDVTVHLGTGIVTSYEFYYNDNEYSITTTTSLGMTDASFNLNSREPYLPTLAVAAELSSSAITQGDSLTVSAHVEDEEGSPVEDVSAVAVVDDYAVQLSDRGGGDYQGSLETSDLPEGQHEVVVVAEGVGYASAQSAVSLTVEKASGIPGFPVASVLLGILIGILLLSRMRTL